MITCRVVNAVVPGERSETKAHVARRDPLGFEIARQPLLFA